jgi:hypothetical protein
MSFTNELTARARLRAYAMIKIGEWFDTRDAAFRLAVKNCVFHTDRYGRDEISAEEALDEIMPAIAMLDSIDDELFLLKGEISAVADDDGFYKGELYMTNRFACPEHRKITILPAEQLEHQQKTPKKKVNDEA